MHQPPDPEIHFFANNTVNRLKHTKDSKKLSNQMARFYLAEDDFRSRLTRTQCTCAGIQELNDVGYLQILFTLKKKELNSELVINNKHTKAK